MSHRYSQHAGREFGALDDTNADISILYSKKNRASKARWGLLWVITYGALISYIIAVTILFSDVYKDKCVLALKWFLEVYMFIAAAQLVRAVASVLLFLYAKDPGTSQMKMEVFYGYWVALIEIGWTFYGNWVVYSDKVEDSCAESEAVAGSGLFTA